MLWAVCCAQAKLGSVGLSTVGVHCGVGPVGLLFPVQEFRSEWWTGVALFSEWWLEWCEQNNGGVEAPLPSS